MDQRDTRAADVFSITPAGHEELLRWLREEEFPAGFRNPLLMKTFFLGELPVEENLAFFRAFRDALVFPDGGRQAIANADMYRQAVDHPEKAIYWKFTIQYGRMMEQMHREWFDECIRELEELQRRQKADMGEEKP